MKFRQIYITLIVALIIFLPAFVFADPPGPPAKAPFIPLVGIPGFNAKDINGLGFGTYINTLYRLSISLAALLAVVKIVMAGAKYMLSDIVTHKEEAKNDIKGALVGLLIIIGAVLILNTVNTDITKNTIMISRSDVSTKNTLDGAISDILNRIKIGQESCDAKFKTTCILTKDINIDKAWCDLRKGNFVDGSAQKLLFGGNLYNSCYYPSVNVNGEATTPCSGTNDGSMCSTISCQYFDSMGATDFIGWAGYISGTIGKYSGADLAANIVQCQARCLWLGGTRLTDGLTDSGVCEYPVDQKNNLKTKCEAQGHTWIDYLDTCSN